MKCNPPVATFFRKGKAAYSNDCGHNLALTQTRYRVIISTDLNMTFRQKSVKISDYQTIGKFNTIPAAGYSGHCGSRSSNRIYQ